MIPKHKCLIYSNLYCQPEEGIHCWPDQIDRQGSDSEIADYYRYEGGVEVLKWRPEDDVAGVISKGLLGNIYGEPFVATGYEFQILIWGRELK